MRFLMCDSEVATLVTVWVIIRRRKGQGRSILNMHPLLPLAFIFWCKKLCVHSRCAKCGSWQWKQHKRAETAAGPCGTGQGGIRLCSGLSLPWGKSHLASVLDGAGSGGKEANFFIQSPSEHCWCLGREDGFQEGMSAQEEGVPKRCGWQWSSWPLLLTQIGLPRRILITAQLLSP